MSRAPTPEELAFGERIAEARKRANLTQEQLGRAIGISRAAISQWELGETKSAKPAHLFRAADVTSVSPRWLATGAGPMDAQPDLSAAGVIQIVAEYIADRANEQSISADSAFLQFQDELREWIKSRI